MDPIQLQQLMQMMQQRQMGGGMQPMGQQPMQQPPMGAQQGQLPSFQPQQPAPQQLPAMGAQQHHGGGFNPLMLLSPMGGLMASHPGAAMFGLSPALGFARMLGAFK